MVESKLVLLVLYTSICITSGLKLKVYNNVTDTDYETMPPVFHLDNYDKCLNIKDDTLYCSATIHLTPLDVQNPSKVWRIIEDMISLPRSYRHDILRHGICVPTACPNIPKHLYTTGNGSKELNTEISKCYSKKYKSQGISVAEVMLQCQNKEPIYKIDTLDKVYGFIMGAFLFLHVIGMAYDGFNDSIGEPTSSFGKIMKAFSLRNNWRRLRTGSGSEDAKAMAPIQGVRVYNMLFVILSHTTMVEFAGPIYNTKYVEDVTTNPANMLLSNGGVICQTFLMISGWLLSYNMCGIFQNKKVQYQHVILGIVNRYLRLAPSLLIVIGFSATWLRHMDRGPVWDKIVGDEFRNCRSNWPSNMLFINNYYKSNAMCLQQTWYLGADMQLFILGLLVMMFLINNPKYAKMVFSSLILLGLFTTFAEHFYYEYDIVIRSYPEILYSVYLKLDEWRYMYIPGHTNIASYVQGLACGYYFYKFKKENKTFTLNRFWGLVWTSFVWITPLGTIFIAAIFYSEGYEYTRLQAALYQSISRYSFELGISVAIFGFCFGIGWHMVSVVRWEPLQVLGRLSFSVYLTHALPIRLREGIIRSPVYVSEPHFIQNFLGDAAAAYLLGTVFFLLIEMPLSVLQRMFLQPAPNPKPVKTE